MKELSWSSSRTRPTLCWTNENEGTKLLWSNRLLICYLNKKEAIPQRKRTRLGSY
jgi:hypothetical protein